MKLVKSLKLVEKLKLYDKTSNKFIDFKLWDRQKEMLDTIQRHRKVIILKKRQIGASQLVGADSLVQCLASVKFETLILSKTAQDAEEFLKRIRDMYRSLPEEIRAINPVKKGLDAGDEMWFTSGSRLISLPAVKGRGMSGDRVVLDEAAFITKQIAHVELPEVLMNIGAVTEKAEGQTIIISTANGLNEYQRLWTLAERGESTYKPFFFSCWSDPTFTRAKRDELLKDYGQDHVSQEYPETPREAFLSSGRPRFDMKALDYYRERIITPIARGTITENGVVDDPVGEYMFYQKKNPRGQYAVFADVAEGIEGNDYSCAKVIDIETWELVCEWHGHIEHYLFGSVLATLGRHYNNAFLCPEANNHGHSAITQMRMVENYPEELIFESNHTRERSDDDIRNPEKRYGWQTNSKTKKTIINNLAALLISKEIPALTEADIKELETYIIEKNGSTNAESGCFDDRVMTLAIAYYVTPMLEIMRPPEYHKCENCEYYKADTKTCYHSERKCKEDQYCRMFHEITYAEYRRDLNDLYGKSVKIKVI